MSQDPSGKPDETTTSRIPEKVRSLDEMSTRQLRTFLKGYWGDWRADAPRSHGVPAPPIQNPCPMDSARIGLPDPEAQPLGDVPFCRLVRQRRSRTAYADTPLTLEELSFLLWCTQGISHVERNEGGDIVYHLRNVPSAGARHPLETSLLVHHVTGLDPGLYRFLPVEHELAALSRNRSLHHEVFEACYRQEFIATAAVVFVWTAVPFRTEWGYGYVAHRMIAAEAGHVCQNLYLASEAIGAGTCAVMGYNQDRLDRLVGVDGEDEFTLYLAAVGKLPEPNEREGT